MILHLATFLQGGAGRCLTTLATAQRRAGHAVTVVASATGEAEYENYPEYLHTLADEGVAVLLHDSLFKRDLAKVLAVVDRVRAAARGHPIELIHGHAAVPALAGLLISRGADGAGGAAVPVIQTMHGWGTRKTPEQAAMDVAIMRQVDHLVATSHASRELLIERGLTPSRISVIPCGLPSETPAPSPRDDVTADLEAARARGDHVLLCIGSVTENKCQRLLVEALAVVARQARARVRCAFIGEGTVIGELERLAAAHAIVDVVRFYGHRPQAAAYLSLADGLVLPSRMEGQGLAVLEAFRAGVLTIVSATPALTELVSNERTGLTFRADDPGDLARVIVDALTLAPADRARMVSAARSLFHERFTIDAMIEAHEQLARSLCRA